MRIRPTSRALSALSLVVALGGVATLSGQSGRPPGVPPASQGAELLEMQPWRGWGGPPRSPAPPPALPSSGPLDWMREQADKEAPCPPGWCDTVPGRVLVKLKAPSSYVRTAADVGGLEWQSAREQERAMALTALQAHGIRDLEPIFPGAVPPPEGRLVLDAEGAAVPVPDLTRWYVATFDGPATPEKMAEGLLGNASVAMAEPDYLRRPIGEPRPPQAQRLRITPQAPSPDLPTFNDPLYPDQWHLGAVNAPGAWGWLDTYGLPAGGSRNLVVAVIDTGIDYAHPDLAANLWVNARETPGNGLDDDGNGYRDDVYGIDATVDTGHANSGNPMDDHGHGTHVAGIVAAQAGNGIGGVGVAFNVRVMALKAAQYSGVLATSDIAEAIYYAVAQGVDVINMSFGGYARSNLEEDALTVAFGQAVLVAAAGNDGKVNLPCPFGRNMYPAAYNWVLGVMASTPDGGRASFSNYDCIPRDRNEYELLAPGVDIWSTLPREQYAAWDGTSMATPIVSAMAALVRTRFSDKDVYSSRFVMGQIASNGANALTAITIAPKPHLSYLEHWTFDTTAQSSVNDNDGRVDAGETIELGIVIRNHWGKADPVSVKLEAQAASAFQPDPFVTFAIDTVDYGAVGAFNWDDNGLIYDTDGVITGVRNPFRFSVDANTPNDHVIPFKVTMTARNGFDASDTTVYTFTSRFELIVQRGRELPRIISSDMTLTKDDFWIVDGPTLIEPGVTVTVGPGTKVQWGSADPNAPYSSSTPPRLQVEGSLVAVGTYQDPIDFFPSGIIDGGRLRVDIENTGSMAMPGSASGRVNLQYVRVNQPKVRTVEAADHCFFFNDLNVGDSGLWTNRLTKSVMHGWDMQNYFTMGQASMNLFEARQRWEWRPFSATAVRDSVFLQNSRDNRSWWASPPPGAGTVVRDRYRFLQSSTWGGHTYVIVAPQNNMTPGGTDTIYAFGRQAARYFGGTLAVIDSAEENAAITSYMTAVGVESVLIGLTDSAQEGSFVWDDGSPLSYVNWSTTGTPGMGEPNNGGCATCNEDYVNFNRWDGRWYDTSWGERVLLELPGDVDTASLASPPADMFRYVAREWNQARDNAFLSKYWDPDVSHWMKIESQPGRSTLLGINGNYWGTTSRTLIDATIFDFYDDFNRAEILYEPILETPAETTYPFAWKVLVGGVSAEQVPTVGSGALTFTVFFNRDMDQTVQPLVSFGPDVPYTDYTVHKIDGGWQDARTWAGTFNINPITGDGYQLMRIAGARAADDPWLVTGNDEARFRFEVITSGTEAMNLQANGGEGHVDLSWTQDDFDLLAGFNIYRSTSATTGFQRVNTGVISSSDHAWRDTNVQPGVPYYYHFTVVKTDLTESSPSNVATATPVDTILPVITHAPVTSAPPGLALSLQADVTDNVRVTDVTLFYKKNADAQFTSLPMTKTTGNRFVATIPAEAMTSPGVQYYIQATDGVGTASSGRAELPWQVAVVDRPVVTSVSPTRGLADGGTAVVVSGSNFKTGATVTFGGAAGSSVVVTSATQITCNTPPHFPMVVDIVVTNPDGQAGTLLRGFTYESGRASVSLPAAQGGERDIVTVPLSAGNVAGMGSAAVTISFNASILTPRAARTGTLTPGWTIVTNTSTPGQVRIAMVSGGGTTTAQGGTLAFIDFEVIGGPGTSTPLQLTSVSLNDGLIPVDAADGTFTVAQVYSVAGLITFWNGGAVVPGVNLRLVGDREFTGMTGADGRYRTESAPQDSYVLTPSKSDDAKGISAFDASLVLQHVAGVATLTGSALVAADVNRDGSATAMDALQIMQKSVGLITLPFQGAGAVWVFSPPTRSYSPLGASQTDQNFTGILLGDPSGNWPTATSRAGSQGDALPGESPAIFTLPDTQARAGAQFTVPLTFVPGDRTFTSVEFELAYDAAVLAPVALAKGAALPPDWLLVARTDVPGIVRVALAGQSPLGTAGPIVDLTFSTLAAPRGESSPLLLRAVDLNEGRVSVSAGHGAVKVVREPNLITGGSARRRLPR